MSGLDGLWGFVLVSLLVELTPGPNMSYLAIISTAHGRRAGLATVAGIALGLLLVGVAAAFGAGAVIENSPLLYEILRYGGAFYLLWLAWCGWRGEDAVETLAPDHRRFFRRGLVTNLLNPKAAVFYIATLPVFIGDAADATRAALGLTLVYVAVATLVHGAIAVMAAEAGRVLLTPRRRRVVARVLSLLLALVALWFLLATRR